MFPLSKLPTETILKLIVRKSRNGRKVFLDNGGVSLVVVTLRRIWTNASMVPLPSTHKSFYASQLLPSVLLWRDLVSWIHLKETAEALGREEDRGWRHGERGKVPLQWDKILFEILGRTWRVSATVGSPKSLAKVGERFVYDALKFCSKKHKNYFKTASVSLTDAIPFQPKPKHPREVYGSEDFWQLPPGQEVAIMVCGDSKLLADYACGVMRISKTNKYRLGAAL